MSSFSSIRTQLLNLEKQTDQNLIKYSNYEKNLSLKEDPDQELRISSTISELLTRRDEFINKLNTINEFENLSTSKLQQLTRHKEILIDHKQIYTKLSNSINDIKSKNNLMFSIRSDLDHHQQQQLQHEPQDPNDYILDESVRVNDFNSIANRLLSSAYQTRDELLNQRNYLNNAQLTLTNSIQRIPGVNVLISKINTRRKRDTVILALVISLCILFLFFI